MTEFHDHEELQYLNLVKNILEKGTKETGRNGDTIALFGTSMRFSLKDGTIPFLTTKKLAWKTCFKELIWFIQGRTSNEELVKQNVHIWSGNGSREFLDSRGLFDREEGDLGPIYGFQWRHFNAPYVDSQTDYTGQGVDQLQQIIDCLKDPNQRSSRRLIMTAWNPCQLNSMALPPCHVLCQFNVRANKYLSCSLYQRSGDIGLGVPFNIASYSLLTHIIATHCHLIAEDFVYFLGNAHIYCEHIETLKQQIKRVPKEFPRLTIQKKETIEEYTLEDISWIQPYESCDPLQMKMKA